jgi:hypothetical protein
MRGTVEQRFLAKVNKTDDCWEWTGAKITTGYGNLYSEGRMRGAHRISYEIAYGPFDQSMDIDHICHNRGCVNPEHLRVVDRKQNMQNRAGAREGSASGIRGVSWHSIARKWAARVYHDGKGHYLGLFSDLAEAEAAAITKRNELFTHNDADRRAA